ncbi:MAG: tetratricopeptide repeat protein [Acidobacteriota bacterium]|nr:tetratricopeptide repeat protein [Acidobacteriota bacterium]
MTRSSTTFGIILTLASLTGGTAVHAQARPGQADIETRDSAGALVPMDVEVGRKIEQLAEDARSHPNDGRTLARYGLALVRTGRLDDGLAALTRAVVLAPEEPLVNLSHAKGLWKGGYSSEAVTAALKVVDSPLSTSKDRAEAYFVAGTIRSMQGDFDAAEEFLRKSIEANPKNVGALLNLGLMLVSREKRSEGLALLDKARTHGPDNARVHATFAQVSEQLGHLGNAIVSWERVAELRPADPNIHLRLGGSYMGSQEFEKAARSFATLVELEPENGTYYLAYGEALLRLRLYDEAMEQAKTAAQLGEAADSLVSAIRFERKQYYDASTAAGQ